MKGYVSTKTGNALVLEGSMFHWRGRWFPGLVDKETNALYDHPDDSFCEHLGIKTSLERGLIAPEGTPNDNERQ